MTSPRPSLAGRLRNAWRALMGTTALAKDVVVIQDPQEAQPKGMRISSAALWESRRDGRRLPTPHDIFDRPKPVPGTLPDGLAFDDACPTNDIGAWGIANILDTMIHEGMTFLGYQYLAQLSQRAEYRHATEIWADHMTRNWIDIKGPEEKVKAITAEFDRLGVKEKFAQITVHDGLFGRGHLFLDFGDSNRASESTAKLVIDERKINPKRPLKSINVVEPMWLYPGMYNTMNPLAQDFFCPDLWYVQGRMVHTSRLLTLVRRPVPDILKPSYAFGGMPLTQMMKPYVDNWLRTRQSVSDMVHSFSTMVLKTDGSSFLAGGDGAAVFQRADLFNQARDNRGLMLVDKGTEDLTNVAVPLSGLDKLQAQAQEQLASVSRIPLSIYLQITPTGLNASSEGETRSFYSDVHSEQENDFTPLLKTLLDVVQLSLFGAIDEEITFVYNPLWETSDVDKATLRKTDAETDSAYIREGVVSNEEARKRLNEDETSVYHGRLAGPPPEPEDEEDGAEVGEDAAVPFGDGKPGQPRDWHGRFAGGIGGAIVQHVTKVLAGKGNHPPLSLGKVSDTNAALVKSHTGFDISGHERSIESSDIRHVIASHGNAAKEADRGQAGITKSDFANIPAIVESSHTVTLTGASGSKKPQRLVYNATIGSHEYEYVEEIRGANKIVALKTMWKR